MFAKLLFTDKRNQFNRFTNNNILWSARKNRYFSKQFINAFRLAVFYYQAIRREHFKASKWNCQLFCAACPCCVWQVGRIVWTTAGLFATTNSLSHPTALPTPRCEASRGQRGRRATEGCQGKRGCQGGTVLTTRKWCRHIKEE